MTPAPVPPDFYGPLAPNAPLYPKRLVDSLDPGHLRNLVMHVAYSFQVCEDLVFMNLIGTVNTAINGKFAVMRASGHTEFAQIYGLVLGKPAERKSRVVNWMKGPLLTLAGPQRLYFDRVRETALIEALHATNGKLSCHEPEGGALELFGRRDFPPAILNNSYDGEAITLDRARKKLIRIEKPSISLMINVQPELAFPFGRLRHVAVSGLLGRFVFLLTQSRAGLREVDTPPVSAEWEGFYSQLIERLFKIPVGIGDERHVLTLTPAAEKMFLDFAREAESALRPGWALSFDTAWGGKFPGKVLRLAVILHCIQHIRPAYQFIDDSTVRQAIEMGRVLIDHAKLFYFQVLHGEAAEVAWAIEQWAVRSGQTRFTAKQANAGLPQYSRNMINAGIAMLVTSHRAYEDLSVDPETGRRGRPEGPFYRLWLGGGLFP